MLKYLFKAFFSDSYLQHYHDRLYINLFIYFIYLFSHLADAFIQSDLQMRTL